MLTNKNTDKGPTKDVILEAVINGFKEKNWITTYDYSTVRPKVFKTEFIPEDKKVNPFYNIYTYYVHAISRYFDDMIQDPIPTQALAELIMWNQKGKLCIYTSVLLWGLLYEGGIFSADEMKLIQGFYRHPTQGIWGLLIGGDKIDQTGLHSWLEVCNGSVLDMAIVQEQTAFDFDKAPVIMETIPNQMHLCGWAEGKDTIKEYIQQIETESNISYLDWIKYHKDQAIKMFFNDLESMFKVA